MDRSSIILSSSSLSTASVSQFTVTPYKISISAVIYVFCDERSPKTQQREIGEFCLLIMRLIQGLDCSYKQLIKQISSPNLSQKTYKKITEKLSEIATNGLPHMMELMSNIKQLLEQKIQRSSIVGLFIRRMFLYFDKLTFSAVSQLFDDFVDYLQNNDMSKQRPKQRLKHHQKSDTCPQQIQFFISKQLNLIQVNEQLAMSPHDLLESIKLNCDDSLLGVSSPQNDLNDVHFLRYLNSLRINEFASAKESLLSYFDGNSNHISRCWAALNLAILHSHFHHHELALQSIKECISTAQEANDDKCLEYALIWVARVLSQTDSHCDVSQLLNHLQSKANELGLPYVSSISQLQSDKLKSTSSRRLNGSSSPLSSLTPDILAVKHSMNDVLLMMYSSRAAILNCFGACNLAVLTSQVLLHLNVIEPIGEGNVYHVNENTCIGVRNIALHLWRTSGEYHIARDMLLNVSTLFSSYKSELNSIWRHAMAEIDFEYHLNQCQWKSALNAIDIIKTCDETHANVRMAQFKFKNGDKSEAVNLINEIIESDAFGKSMPFIRINAMLLKAKMLNDITLILECIDLSKQYQLTGIECSCMVQLSHMLQQCGQISKSTLILNSIMIKLLANGTCHDIAAAHYIIAVNHLRTYERKMREDGNGQNHLEIARIANERAIDNYRLIGDNTSLMESLKLSANIYNQKQDFSQRNFYARQLRLLLMEVV